MTALSMISGLRYAFRVLSKNFSFTAIAALGLGLAGVAAMPTNLPARRALDADPLVAMRE